MSQSKNDLLTNRGVRRQVLLALGWYARDLHQGVASYAREARWSLNIEMERVSKPPEQWRGQGVICILGMDHNVDDLIMSWKVPTVSIGPVAGPSIPRVEPDNLQIGKMAFEHFFTRGFRHFAYYRRSGGPGETLRFNGFRHHVEKAGFKLHTVSGSRSTPLSNLTFGPAEYEWLGKQIAKLPKPLALLAEYDDRALEIIEGCHGAGLQVPEEVAVLGVDNDELRCEFAPVPLSSIDDDQHQQGYEAARLLDLLIDQKTVPETTRIKPRRVVTRVSTDILAIEHPKVAAALRLIWNHYREPLTAGDVADAVPMSGRRLHDAFTKYVGRSISEEIKRRRVEHAKSLLANKQRMKLEAIAMESGFTSGDRMAKVFSSMTGETPSAYRKRIVTDYD